MQVSSNPSQVKQIVVYKSQHWLEVCSFFHKKRADPSVAAPFLDKKKRSGVLTHRPIALIRGQRLQTFLNAKGYGNTDVSYS